MLRASGFCPKLLFLWGRPREPPDPSLKPYLCGFLTPSSAFLTRAAFPEHLCWLTAPIWKSPGPPAQVHSGPGSPHPAFMENSGAATAVPGVLREPVVCGRRTARPKGRNKLVPLSPASPWFRYHLTEPQSKFSHLIGFHDPHLQGLVHSGSLSTSENWAGGSRLSLPMVYTGDSTFNLP